MSDNETLRPSTIARHGAVSISRVINNEKKYVGAMKWMKMNWQTNTRIIERRIDYHTARVAHSPNHSPQSLTLYVLANRVMQLNDTRTRKELKNVVIKRPDSLFFWNVQHAI